MNVAFCKYIVLISIIGLILAPSLSGVNAAELLSPHKQMASGIDAKNVKCKSSFVLMVRSTNGFAACVKPSTSEKLSNTGWGTIVKTAMEEPNEETSEQPESAEETQGNAIEVKIKDGVGTTENP